MADILNQPIVCEPVAQKDRTKLLFALACATWIEFYTFDSINLILPDIAGDFGVSQDQASWVLTTYSSALFVGVALSIGVANQVGYRRYIVGCAVAFAVASVGCAGTSDFASFLVWRVIQGFAGGGLTMWWRASIYVLVAPAQRSMSLMRVSVMLYLATSFGLLFGGYVTDNLSWRLVFIPNVLVVIAAVIMLLRYYPPGIRFRERETRRDVPGTLLIGSVLVSVQIVLSRGDTDDWFGSSGIQILSWLSLITFLLFVAWQVDDRNAQPIFRLELLQNRNVSAAALLGLFTGVMVGGSTYALPEFLRTVSPLHLNASRTGEIMCAYALTAACIRPVVTRAIGRFKQRKAMAFALIMLIFSMLWTRRLMTSATPDIYFVGPLVFYGFCIAPLLSSVGGGTVARVGAGSRLDAVSIYMTCRQFGTSLGVTLVALVIHRRESYHSAHLFEHLQSGAFNLTSWLRTAGSAVMTRAGMSSADATSRALKMLGDAAGQQAEILAYADSCLFMAAVAAVTLLLVPIMEPAER